MDFKIIIHAIILLFILHIVIINIDYEITVGKKYENFKNLNNNNSEKKDSLDFLLQNQDNDNEFIKNMNDISKSFDDNNINQEINNVLPSNNYLDNDNKPNFDSNVENVSKFYKNNYNELNENDLKSTLLHNLNNQENSINLNQQNTPLNIPNPSDISSDNFKQKENPPVWEYNNEFAMNGGNMNGIIGFDGLESQYADFGSFSSLTNNSNKENNNVPHDDLRKPSIVN